MGVYPDVPLAATREKCEELARGGAGGIDPGEQRKVAKLGWIESTENSFELIGRERFGTSRPRGSRVMRTRSSDDSNSTCSRGLGSRTINGITPPKLLAVLRRVESPAANETTHDTLGVGERCRSAATGRGDRDPSPDLSGTWAPTERSGSRRSPKP